jgi:sugar lactone lactonase YvrE
MTAQQPVITAVTPSMGVPGGEVSIRCEGFVPGLPGRSRVLVGKMEAGIVTASEELVVARLPDSPQALGITIEVNGFSSQVFPFALASQLAAGLNPVSNPALAPDGSIITTISGKRGEQVPQPIIRISPSGEKTAFACEITNPTGLAYDANGQLHITSRHDGIVVRYTDYEHLEVVAEDLGIACGIAFDSKGLMYVGDRSGKIYRINRSGGREEYAALEPSVSAYHLAIDTRDRLYVTGPTLSLRDPLYRITGAGEVEEIVHGLARPQGVAFLPDGDLLIAAAYRGKKGVFRYSPDKGDLSLFIAAPMLVGLAVARDRIILADTASLFRLQPDSKISKVV